MPLSKLSSRKSLVCSSFAHVSMMVFVPVMKIRCSRPSKFSPCMACTLSENQAQHSPEELTQRLLLTNFYSLKLGKAIHSAFLSFSPDSGEQTWIQSLFLSYAGGWLTAVPLISKRSSDTGFASLCLRLD